MLFCSAVNASLAIHDMMRDVAPIIRGLTREHAQLDIPCGCCVVQAMPSQVGEGRKKSRRGKRGAVAAGGGWDVLSDDEKKPYLEAWKGAEGSCVGGCRGARSVKALLRGEDNSAKLDRAASVMFRAFQAEGVEGSCWAMCTFGGSVSLIIAWRAQMRLLTEQRHVLCRAVLCAVAMEQYDKDMAVWQEENAPSRKVGALLGNCCALPALLFRHGVRYTA